MIKVIIVDDHPLMLDGIRTALSDSTEIKIIGEAMNGKDLLKLLSTNLPDIILLDIMMPELDGIETLKIVKKKFRHVKVIVLTQFGERRFIKNCIDLGAEGFLLKDCGTSILKDAIIAVFKGGTYFNSYNFNRNKLHKHFKPDILSNREYEILTLIAGDKPCKEIANRLNLSINTVRTYRNRLLIKSGNNTLAGLVQWANDNNLI
ncbi:MAG: response regulator transcription factor [Bacteroidetes bacterium]|nr:response regulator transcription factor [Bacteroidota bacterium]MBL7102980.1 response regulator transcription factor [Bacteroidales bacterium]